MASPIQTIQPGGASPIANNQTDMSQMTLPQGAVINNGSGPRVNTSMGLINQPGAAGVPAPAETPDTMYSRLAGAPLENDTTGTNQASPDLLNAQRTTTDTIKGLQSAVDVVNQRYDQKLAEFGSGQGNDNEGRARSLSAMTGLAGSTSADANQGKAATTNKAQQDVINQERAQKINQIYGAMDQAQNDFNTAKQTNDTQVQAQQAKLGEQRATSIAQAFAKELNGATFSQFQQADPQTYNSLLTLMGGNIDKLKLAYNAASATPVTYDTKSVPGYAIYADPKTGEIHSIKMDTPAGFEMNVASDGTPLLFNKQTGALKIASGFEKGELAKPTDPLDNQYKQAQIAKLNSDIKTADASGNAVSPEVLSGMMNVYKATGVVPPLGNSAKSPLRAQFYAALGGADGSNIVSDANTNKVVRSGINKAYTTQQNLYSANQVAINTLDKQLDLAKKYSDQVSRSDSPLVAKYVNSLKSGVFGDPDTAAFNNIVKTAANEFAKILSGSAASVGGVTVSSAAEAEQMLNTAMSKGQFNAVMGLMKQEAQIRLQSQKDQLDQLQKDSQDVGKLSDDLKTASSTGGTTGATTLMTGPDGKDYNVPTDKVDAFVKAGGKQK